MRLSLFQYEISSYVFFNLIAAAILFIVGVFKLKKSGLDWSRIAISSSLMIVMFFVGSRLLYGILYPEKFIENPTKLFEFKLVNFSLYGGLILSLLTWIALSQVFGSVFAELTDKMMPALGIALAISKLGCFFNGCCYGVPTKLPWGIVFERADQSPLVKAFGSSPFLKMISGSVEVPRHPTQLYEVFFALLAVCVVLWLIHEKARPGIPTLAFVNLFTTGRFISFWFRDFPYASDTSNFVRGPLIYGIILVISYSITLIYLRYPVILGYKKDNN